MFCMNLFYIDEFSRILFRLGRHKTLDVRKFSFRESISTLDGRYDYPTPNDPHSVLGPFEFLALVLLVLSSFSSREIDR